MARYQGKYRIESTRLKGWDYSRAGWYFVTICTREQICHFGAVSTGQVIRSPVGDIVAEEWQRTPLVRLNVQLDAWVVMPNHLHGIIAIQDKPGATLSGPNIGQFGTAKGEPPNRLKPGSLGAIIGQIKSVCQKRIHAIGANDFEWQPRFYDNIIRDDHALANIREYIANNPAKWSLDELNPDHA